MASELRVDTGVLHEQSSRLKLIATEFNSADTVADIAEQAVGIHPDTGELRHQINGFSSSWRIRREKMQVKIEDLQGYIEHVATTFDDTDQQLAQGISGTQDSVDFSGGSSGGW